MNRRTSCHNCSINRKLPTAATGSNAVTRAAQFWRGSRPERHDGLKPYWYPPAGIRLWCVVSGTSTKYGRSKIGSGSVKVSASRGPRVLVHEYLEAFRSFLPPRRIEMYYDDQDRVATNRQPRRFVPYGPCEIHGRSRKRYGVPSASNTSSSTDIMGREIDVAMNTH